MKLFIWLFMVSFLAFGAVEFTGTEDQIIELEQKISAKRKEIRLLERKMRELRKINSALAAPVVDADKTAKINEVKAELTKTGIELDEK